MSDYTQYYVCDNQICKYYHWIVKYAKEAPEEPTCGYCFRKYNKLKNDGDNLLPPSLLTGQ